MGNKPALPVKIFCFGNKDKVINAIFPLKDELTKDKWEHRMLKKSIKFKENETNKELTENIEWRATLYPDLTDENIDELFDNLSKKLNIPKEFGELDNQNEDYNSRERSKNIIIKFGKQNVHYLINFMNDIKKTHLPQIAIVTEEPFNESEEGLNDNRYLTIIKKCDKKLIDDYLWEKDCYYNERGNISLNLDSNKVETNNFINIILTGLSRSGKSTLINVLSGKLLTLESPFFESVTNYIREYKVIVSKNGVFQTGLRFYDTPGLTVIEAKDKQKKRSTINEVKTSINKKLKESKDNKDDIHLIYFMLQSIPNLENYVEFFNFIININKNRIKEGKKKIYVIFIINQNNDSSEQALIAFLKDNKLTELIERVEYSTEKVLSYKEKYSKKLAKSNNTSKYNIVCLNLLKSNVTDRNVYGIDLLLKTTVRFLKKDNPFSPAYFEELKTYKNKNYKDSNSLNIKQTEQKVNNLYSKIALENSFLSSCNNIKNILYKADRDCKVSLLKYLFMELLIPETRDSVVTYLEIFKEIEHIYKIFKDDLILKPIVTKEISGNKMEVTGFQILELEDDICKQSELNILKNVLEIIISQFLSIKKENLNINGTNIFTNAFFITYILDSYFMAFVSHISKYFRNYIEKTFCIDYVLNQKKIYENIFQEIEEMSKKNDWDKFHVEVLK